MNVPSAIARNQLAVIVANSIASNKVLDQYDLYQRVANLLCQGDMTSKEIIANHTRLYRDLTPPPMDRVDSVINDFLTNMIVIWKNVEGKIVFSLSPEIREMANALRPKVKTHSGANFDELVSALSKGDYSKTDMSIHSQIVYFIHHNGPSTVDQLYDANVHRRVGHIEIFKDVLDEMQSAGVLTLLPITGTWCLSDNFMEQVEVYRQYTKNTEGAVVEKDATVTTVVSDKCVDKIMTFEELAVVRAKDNFRDAKTIEGVLVYLLGEVGWDLTRISNELAEFWVIADIHLADVLQRMVDKKVLTLSKPTFEAEPVWSSSIGFMEAVNERRSGKWTSGALASVEERGIGIKRNGGLRRGDLGMLSAPTAPNQSRMFRKQLETDAERGIGKRPVNPMSSEVTAQDEEQKQVPKDQVGDVGRDTFNPKAEDANVQKPYTVITRDREGVQNLDNAYSINHAVLASYLLAAQFDQAQSGRFNFAFAIFYGNTMYQDIASAMVNELRIDYLLDSKTSHRYLSELVSNSVIKLVDDGEGEEFEFTAVFDAAIQAELKLKQLSSSSRTAETAHHEAYHAIVEDKFGNVSTAVVGEVEVAKPEFILEFMGTKQTAAAARETYDDVMAVLSKVEDNNMLAKLFPPGAFDNLKQYVEQFDELGTQF